MAKSVYATDGVDFEKEHEVVGVFKLLYKATKSFTEDLRDYGFEPPEDIGYFSDGVVLDVGKLLKKLLGNDSQLDKEVYVGMSDVVKIETLLNIVLDTVGSVNMVDVYASDGPGTKPLAHRAFLSLSKSQMENLKLEAYLAEEAGLSRACVGICGVAMVSNDMNAGGARMAWMEDYISWQDPNIELARDIAAGLYIGAREAGCTVVGGENASLSEMTNGYDMCVFGRGLILNPKYIKNPLTGERIKKGDLIIGVQSSGVHCNGISTTRKRGLRVPLMQWFGRNYLDKPIPELGGKTFVEEILTPTFIYRRPVMAVLEDEGIDVKAMDNVTGEGINNLKRPLAKAEGLGAVIDIKNCKKLKPQPVFELIQKYASMEDREMWGVYNMSTGFRFIVDPDSADKVVEKLEQYEIFGQPVQAEIQGKITDGVGEGVVKVIADGFEDDF